MIFLRFVILLVLLAAPVFVWPTPPVYAASADQAVSDDGDQTLSNPADEARAVALGKQLRCVVCQSESINDSQADMARDMRGLVREKISYGWSDADILEYLRQRYGDFILLKPRFQMKTFALWVFPPLFLIIATGGIFFLLRRDQKRAMPAALADARQAVIAALRALIAKAQTAYQALTTPQPQTAKAPAKVLATPIKARPPKTPSKIAPAKPASMRKPRTKRAIAATAASVEAASMTAPLKKPNAARNKPATKRSKTPPPTASEKADAATTVPLTQSMDIENSVQSAAANTFPENLATTTDHKAESLTPMSGELLASKTEPDGIASENPQPVSVRKLKKPRKPKEI